MDALAVPMSTVGIKGLTDCVLVLNMSDAAAAAGDCDCDDDDDDDDERWVNTIPVDAPSLLTSCRRLSRSCNQLAVSSANGLRSFSFLKLQCLSTACNNSTCTLTPHFQHPDILRSEIISVIK